MICIYQLPAHHGRGLGEVHFTAMDASAVALSSQMKFCENFGNEDNDVVASFVYNKIVRSHTEMTPNDGANIRRFDGNSKFWSKKMQIFSSNSVF